MQDYSLQQVLLEQVWDFKRAQRKKARERKLEIAMEQYNNDIDEAMALGEQRVFDQLAEARKHSHSDNWGNNHASICSEPEIEEKIDYHDPDLWHWYGSGKRWLGDDDEV